MAFSCFGRNEKDGTLNLNMFDERLELSEATVSFEHINDLWVGDDYYNNRRRILGVLGYVEQ